jgi:hypothetical protein
MIQSSRIFCSAAPNLRRVKIPLAAAVISSAAEKSQAAPRIVILTEAKKLALTDGPHIPPCVRRELSEVLRPKVFGALDDVVESETSVVKFIFRFPDPVRLTLFVLHEPGSRP